MMKWQAGKLPDPLDRSFHNIMIPPPVMTYPVSELVPNQRPMSTYGRKISMKTKNSVVAR